MTSNETTEHDNRRKHEIRLGSKKVTLPDSRLLRIGAGSALVVGGALGFLPVLGFWMIPLGLIILSIDMHWARRLRRRLAVWLARRYPGIAEKLNGTSQ